MNTPVRMLVADEEDLFREGLSKLLSRDPDIRIVGQAKTGTEARDKARRLQPDVLLMELHMPEMEGLDVARIVHHELPETRIALIARGFTRAELFAAINSGVRGYITKDIQLNTLVHAVKQVSRGEFFIPPESSSMLLEELVAINGSRSRQHDAVAAERAKITERERDVLELLVQGATNRDIARRLEITENTVKVHLRNILDKLQLRNRQQAAAFAVSSGLVKLEREPVAVRNNGGRAPAGFASLARDR